MPLYPVAGFKIYIGGVLAEKSEDFTDTDFTTPAQTWVEIDGWSQMGSFGDSAQVITTALINRSRDAKQKGTSNAGTMENVFAWMPDDAGQAALEAAARPSVKDNYAFKVEAPDGTTTPTTWKFIALAMGFNRSGGGANTIQNVAATLEINSNIVEVAAT